MLCCPELREGIFSSLLFYPALSLGDGRMGLNEEGSEWISGIQCEESALPCDVREGGQDILEMILL